MKYHDTGSKWAFVLSYLSNPSAGAGYDTISIFFYAQFNRFEFRVFPLLD